ncbi:MAG: hypothetical protein KDD38_04150 [Bdellovibrionales bacterium]|nr:hypothetical protein [Bdellovibrionales bacterium]
MKINIPLLILEENKNFEEFSARVLKLALNAQKQNAQILLLPEFLAFELLSSFKSSRKKAEISTIAQNYGHKIMKLYSEVSRQTGVALAGGTLPLIENEQLYNVAGFYTPTGEIHLQKKLFLTPDELALGFSAGAELSTFTWQGLLMCQLICLDVEIPSVSAALAPQSLDLILVPSMVNDRCGNERVYGCSFARAIEHTCFVAGSGAGSSNGHYSGQNYFIHPQIPPFAGRGHSRIQAERAPALDEAQASIKNKTEVFEINIEKKQLAIETYGAIRPAFISAGAHSNFRVNSNSILRPEERTHDRSLC